MMCTGWQPLTLSPIYHTATMVYYRPYSLQQQQSIPSDQNKRQLQAPESEEESQSFATLEFWPCYSMNNNDAPKEFLECRYSIQETSQRLGKQELVFPNHSVNYWQPSHPFTTTNTYTSAEMERRQLLIKPFYSLVPD